jgi:hypothetical protein
VPHLLYFFLQKQLEEAAEPPTTLAMEIQFCRQHEQVSTLLVRMEQMQRQIGEMHQVLFSQGIRNVEIPAIILVNFFP